MNTRWADSISTAEENSACVVSITSRLWATQARSFLASTRWSAAKNAVMAAKTMSSAIGVAKIWL